MNEIDDLLEEEQQLRRDAQAGPDHNAVEAPRFERKRDLFLGGLAEINKAAHDVEPEAA